MKIWIMRHGEAGFNAPSDNQRTLTEKGKVMAFEQGQWLGRRFQQHHILLDKVIISPYYRTQQTAEEVIKGLQAVDFQQNFTNILETWDGITPSGNAETVVDYLTFLQEEGAMNVLLISHLPLVFDLVQALTNNQSAVHFYPAVIAELQKEKESYLITVAEPALK